MVYTIYIQRLNNLPKQFIKLLNDRKIKIIKKWLSLEASKEERDSVKKT